MDSKNKNVGKNLYEYQYHYIEDTEEQKQLIKMNKEALVEIFLSRVYCNFFLFNISEHAQNLKSTILDFLKNFLGSSNVISEELLFNISERIAFNGVTEAYLFPFIKSEYIPYYTREGDEPNVVDYINQFKTIHYSYICVIVFHGKLLILTDIKEDKIFNNFSCLEEKGYLVLEFHKVIPRLIDVLKEKILQNSKEGAKENLINEIGIGFPLSMIGNHALIKTTIKEHGNISSDENFKKIIRFGLLNYFKIKLDYKVSFNEHNEKNKFSLNGFICPKGKELNKILLQHLEKFLKDIDGKNNSSGDFLNLPIYTINSKYSYKDENMFPYFSYNQDTDELKLTITSEVGDGIAESYIINGIFPQYVKTDGERIAYLKTKSSNKTSDIENFELNYFNEHPGEIVCREFLNDYLNIIRNGYSYLWDKNEGEDSMENKHTHPGPNFLIGDLYLTASDNENHYLINISDTKKDNSLLTVETYKLSFDNFGKDRILEIVNKFPGKSHNFIGSIELDGTCKIGGEKQKSIIAKSYTDSTIKFFYSSLKQHYSECKRNGSKSVFEGYSIPYRLKGDYINHYVPYEDLLSLTLMQLLELKGHNVFFGGKNKKLDSRELADIISIQEGEVLENNIKMRELNLNLFHMKLKPFQQGSFSQLEAGYSQYTEVVGQILEKVQSFVDKKDINGILEEIEKFFKNDSGNSLNYVIYENIRDIFLTYDKNTILNINVFFPVRKKDYFPDELENNNLKELAILTNWKRLKMINDVFKSNVDNIHIPGLRMNLNLGLLICEKVNANREGKKNNLYLIKSISELINTIN